MSTRFYFKNKNIQKYFVICISVILHQSKVTEAWLLFLKATRYMFLIVRPLSPRLRNGKYIKPADRRL